jgi:hypothetical protein
MGPEAVSVYLNIFWLTEEKDKRENTAERYLGRALY